MYNNFQSVTVILLYFVYITKIYYKRKTIQENICIAHRGRLSSQIWGVFPVVKSLFLKQCAKHAKIHATFCIMPLCSRRPPLRWHDYSPIGIAIARGQWGKGQIGRTPKTKYN